MYIQKKHNGGKEHEQSTGRRLQNTHRPRTERLQSKAGRETSEAYRSQRKMVQSRRRLDPLPGAEPDDKPERMDEDEDDDEELPFM